MQGYDLYVLVLLNGIKNRVNIPAQSTKMIGYIVLSEQASYSSAFGKTLFVILLIIAALTSTLYEINQLLIDMTQYMGILANINQY